MAERRQIRVLSIDGGGIRGLIPALLLDAIERRAQRPACELFDLIAGTSTGGIIALGVTVPGTGGRPRWSAQELADLYLEQGREIFSRSLLRRIETVDGVMRERYSPAHLEQALERYLGDARLSDALTDVLIPSYDIQTHEPLFFKSAHARAGSAPDFPMRVVARSTSAAPTYFAPEHAIAPKRRHRAGPPDYALVDGGTFANNPAMCAYAESQRDHPRSDVVIVSLGTGRLTQAISYEQAKDWGILQWIRPLLGVVMDGASAAIDYQLDQVLGRDQRHFRFQTTLTDASDQLDDADAANLADLQTLAQATIESDAARIDRVCALLTAPE